MVADTEAEEHFGIRAALLDRYHVIFSDGCRRGELYLLNNNPILYPAPGLMISQVIPRVGRKVKTQQNRQGDWRVHLGELALLINRFPRQNGRI